MSAPQAFYVPQHPEDGRDRFVSTEATAGPWSSRAQHGSPPAALLGRAVERLCESGRVVGRITVDLLGSVPVGPLSTTATVLRPGRSVALLEAVLHDETADRPVARAQAWAFPASTDGPGDVGPPPAHGPGDGTERPPPSSWHAGGYLAASEWRWVHGSIGEPGPASVWMRPRVELVEGDRMSGLQRVLACVDSASGVSAALDPREWSFLNTELTVVLLREPVGEWLCLSAETTLGPGAVGMAVGEVHDELGLVARSSQTLLLARASMGP